MGLDMYAFAAKPALIQNPDALVDLKMADEEIRPTMLAYWRKFNALHGWMEDLYRERGGTGPDFNCNTVRLDDAALRRLEGDIEADALKPRSGFFFGGREIRPEDIESTRKFIVAARQAMADGDVVFYDSWW